MAHPSRARHLENSNMANRVETLPPEIAIIDADDIDPTDTIYEWDGCSQIWRAYEPNGRVTIAKTFKEIYERSGNRWN